MQTYELTATTELHNGDKIRHTTTFIYNSEGVPTEILGWASSNRMIALQRAIRPLATQVALDHANGKVNAKTAGHKPVDIDELIEQLPPEVLQRIIEQHQE